MGFFGKTYGVKQHFCSLKAKNAFLMERLCSCQLMTMLNPKIGFCSTHLVLKIRL